MSRGRHFYRNYFTLTFVAIDRATWLAYLAVYARKNKEAAADFLSKCLAFFPFRVEKLLTDTK